MQNQTVGNAIELLNFFYHRWSMEAPDGNVFNCSDGEFHLRRVFDEMFQVLGRQICKDHEMEDAFGKDKDRTSTIPKDTLLSTRAQQMYDGICLFIGLDPRL